MPQPELPGEATDLLEKMSRDIGAAWAKAKNEELRLLNQWPEDTKLVRLRRMSELQTSLTDLMVRVDDVIKSQAAGTLVTAYEIGAWGSALQAGAAATFTAVDINAIAVLANDTVSELLQATSYVTGATKQTISELSRSALVSKLYTGLTAEQAGIRLAADLAAAGLPDASLISGVVYRDGRRVALTSYTDMVMRTKTALAYQEGGFQQGAQLGIEWWEIMDGPDCGLSYHDDPTLADGMIVPTSQAEKFPISHPNCVRVTSPRPDVTSAADAKNASRTSSAKQVEDQAAASRARAEAYARNPRNVSLTRQVDRELSLRSSFDTGTVQPMSAAEARAATRVAKADAAATSTQSAAAKRAASRTDGATAAAPDPLEKVTKKRTPKWVREDLASQMSRLSEDDLGTLLDYVQNGEFEPMNLFLRTGSTKLNSKTASFFEGDLDPDYIRWKASLLDEAIEKGRTQSSMTLFRGVGDDAVEALKRGVEFVDDGFISTSVDPSVSAGFARNILQIEYPAGRRALFIDAIEELNLGQGEVLLPRGTRFKVTRVVNKADGGKVISVTAY